MATIVARTWGIRLNYRPRINSNLLAWSFVCVLAAFKFLLIVFSPQGQVGPDASTYDGIATDLLNGRSWFDPQSFGGFTYWPPLYPLFLAVVYSAFGHTVLAVRAVQFILYLSIVALSVLLARWIWRRERRQIVLAVVFLSLLSAEYLEAILTTGYELLLAFLLTLSLASIIYAALALRCRITGKIIGAAFLGGISIGLAALTQPKVILFAPLFLLWFALYRRSPRWKVKGVVIVLFALGAAFIVSPWMIRNYLVYHEVIPISTNGGINLFIGNNPEATGDYHWPVADYDRIFYFDSPRESEQMWYLLAVGYIAQHPLETVAVGIRKSINLWSPIANPIYNILRVFPVPTGDFLNLNMNLLCLAGLVLALRDRRVRSKAVLLAGALALLTAIHTITFGEARFRLPLLPVITLLQVAAIVYGGRYFSSANPNRKTYAHSQ